MDFQRVWVVAAAMLFTDDVMAGQGAARRFVEMRLGYGYRRPGPW